MPDGMPTDAPENEHPGIAPTVTTTATTATNPAPTPPQPPSLSQDDINRIAAREKDAGKRAERQALLDKLGVKSLDDVTAALDEARKIRENAMSDQEKAIAQATAEREAAAAERAQITSERRALAAELALLRAGISDDAQRAELVPLVTAKVNDDTDEHAAVERVKATFPQLFTPPTQGNSTPPPSGEPAGGGAPPAPRIADARERGRLRAQKVNGDNSVAFDPIKSLRPTP